MIMCTNQQTGCQRTIVAKINPHSDFYPRIHMLCNESTVLRGERVVLVPYRPEHVRSVV